MQIDMYQNDTKIRKLKLLDGVLRKWNLIHKNINYKELKMDFIE